MFSFTTPAQPTLQLRPPNAAVFGLYPGSWQLVRMGHHTLTLSLLLEALPSTYSLPAPSLVWAQTLKTG